MVRGLLGESLNRHSLDASNVDLLLSEFPKWRTLVRAETDDDGRRYFVVEVKAPKPANVEHGLLISTSNDEVTVGFDTFHSHFDDWVGESESALVFIKQLVTEHVAVLSWWFDDQWRGSTHIEAGAEPTLPKWAGAQPVNRIRVRSWNGTFNSDVNV